MLRWAVRRPRVWAALLAWLGASGLSLGDGRAGWTAFVTLATGLMAALAVRGLYAADHPDAPRRRAERARAKQQAAVDDILRRYEAKKAGLPPPRTPRKKDVKRQERVDAILWRYERQRAARDRERERR